MTRGDEDINLLVDPWQFSGLGCYLRLQVSHSVSRVCPLLVGIPTDKGKIDSVFVESLKLPVTCEQRLRVFFRSQHADTAPAPLHTYGLPSHSRISDDQALEVRSRIWPIDAHNLAVYYDKRD